MSQPVCSRADRTLQSNDDDLLNLVNDFMHGLFPVAQLVYEPSGVSACTRFAFEYVKLTFMQHIIGMQVQTFPRCPCCYPAPRAEACVQQDVNKQRESTARWRSVLCSQHVTLLAFVHNGG